MDITCQRTITADGREILYSLERKQVKNLNLRVRKDGSVWVSADPGVPCGEIDAFVVSKAPYIQKALDHFHEMAQYRPQPKQYVSGEAFNILGRGLRLQVTQAAKDSISADGVYIHLGVRDLHDIERKRRVVNRFLGQQCRTVFGDVMDALYPSFQKYGVQKPSLRMFARLLAFSNGDLQSLYDRSNGFYRRQLILTTRERQPDRVDDPDIAEKMCCELEGIVHMYVCTQWIRISAGTRKEH